MRILIAYDGSDEAKRTIESLPSSCFQADVCPATRLTRMAHSLANLAALEAQAIASDGAARAAPIFPRWTVTTGAGTDAAPAILLKKAEEWGADCLLLSQRPAGRGAEPSGWRQILDGRAAGVLLRRVSAACGALLGFGHEGYEALVSSGAAETLALTA